MTRSNEPKHISAHEAAALVQSGEALRRLRPQEGDAGLQHYIPCNLGEISDYYRRFIDPPDIMVIKTCPIDATGTSTSVPRTSGTERSRLAPRSSSSR